MKITDCLFPPAMERKIKNCVFIGEAGSGKSEIAINLACAIAAEGSERVHFFDLDMTKPIFRSRDQAGQLTEKGVEVHFETQFMDAPTAAGGVERLLRNDESCVVLDIGGDHMGARSIGRYATLMNQNNTAVFYVVNPFRPWSRTLEQIDGVLGEILAVSHISKKRLFFVGNPNCGPDSTRQDVLHGYALIQKMLSPHVALSFFCVREELYEQLKDTIPRLCPLHIYMRYPWDASPGSE